MMGLDGVPDIEDAQGEITDPAMPQSTSPVIASQLSAIDGDQPDVETRQPTLRIESPRGSRGAEAALAHLDRAPAKPLSLPPSGRIDQVEVPRLLWQLNESRFTGRVVLRRGSCRETDLGGSRRSCVCPQQRWP